MGPVSPTRQGRMGLRSRPTGPGLAEPHPPPQRDLGLPLPRVPRLVERQTCVERCCSRNPASAPAAGPIASPASTNACAGTLAREPGTQSSSLPITALVAAPTASRCAEAPHPSFYATRRHRPTPVRCALTRSSGASRCCRYDELGSGRNSRGTRPLQSCAAGTPALRARSHLRSRAASHSRPRPRPA